MVYRIPTSFDSFIPPPPEQVTYGYYSEHSPSASTSSQSQDSSTSSLPTSPWRGSLIVSGLRASDKSSSIEIRAVGVEIEGDCSPRSSNTEIWPQQLFFSTSIITRRSSPASESQTHSSMAHAFAEASRARSQSQTHSHPSAKLSDVMEWLKRAQEHNGASMVSFIPDRVRDPNANAVNQTNFRNLSRVLWDSQSAAIIPWNRPSNTNLTEPHLGRPDSGILLYPTGNSSTVLIGIVFIDTPFPLFIQTALGSSEDISIMEPMTLTIPSASSSSSTYLAAQSGASPSSLFPLHHHPIHTHTPVGQPRSHPLYQPRTHSKSLSPISVSDIQELSSNSTITSISAHGRRQFHSPLPVQGEGETYRPEMTPYSHLPDPILPPLPPIGSGWANTPNDNSQVEQEPNVHPSASSSAHRGGHSRRQ